MRGQQLHLYATHRDLVSLLNAARVRGGIAYAEAGLFNKAALSLINEATELEAFKTYLAFFRGEKVVVRPVPQVGVTIKYAIDQLENRNTIAIQIGGQHGSLRLVASHIGTTSGSKVSAELFRLHAREVKARFERIKSYWVGPEAAALLDTGWRLMPTTRSAPEYDLTRER